MTFGAVREKQTRGWIEEAELEMDNWVISKSRTLTGTIDDLVKSSDYGKDDIYDDGACSDDESDYDDEEEP